MVLTFNPCLHLLLRLPMILSSLFIIRLLLMLCQFLPHFRDDCENLRLVGKQWAEALPLEFNGSVCFGQIQLLLHMLRLFFSEYEKGGHLFFRWAAVVFCFRGLRRFAECLRPALAQYLWLALLHVF